MARILVVDDAEEQRLLISSILRQAGHEVGEATDGFSALGQMRGTRWDIVITDLRMPRMDGLELVKNSRDEFPGIPIVLITAHGNAAIAHEALQQGAVYFIPKDCLTEDLIPTVDRLSSKLRARIERRQVVQNLVMGQARFELGNEIKLVAPLVNYIEASVAGLLGRRGDPATFQLGTALSEAILNAVYHGNLGLDSSLREGDGAAWFAMAEERLQQSPFMGRMVRVDVDLRPESVTLAVEDEGDGFDPRSLPDPTEGDNLLRVHGRGIFLIRTFMDSVVHNDKGNRIEMRKEFPSRDRAARRACAQVQ